MWHLDYYTVHYTDENLVVMKNLAAEIIPTRICSNIDMAELARTHQSCGLRANLRIEEVVHVDLYPT